MTSHILYLTFLRHHPSRLTACSQEYRLRDGNLAQLEFTDGYHDRMESCFVVVILTSELLSAKPSADKHDSGQ